MRPLTALLTLILLSISASATTIYVDANGTGDYPTIQAAIDVSNDGDVIVLLRGIYIGTGNYNINLRGKSIKIKGDTGDPYDCIIPCRDTNISFEQGGFKFINGEDANSILEAVTIKKAYSPRGGAICCINSSPTIKNCVISENRAGDYGGGIYNLNSNQVIVDCTIISNRTSVGAGICNWSSNPKISSCTIIGNIAHRSGGGIFNNYDSNPIIYNCIITGNSAGREGGGIWIWDSSPRIINCIISGNLGTLGGGGIYIVNKSLFMYNSIIWGNNYSQIYSSQYVTRIVSYCNVQGGYEGIFNINIDPCFVDPNNGDYHLLPVSLCINAGDPNYVAEPDETDLDGLERIIDGRIDMGCYESDALLVPLRLSPDSIYVRSFGGYIMAMMTMPHDIIPSDINNSEPLLFLPGKVESIRQFAWQSGRGRFRKTYVMSIFDKSDCMEHLSNGLNEVTVIGQLTSGQFFYGTDDLRIIPRQPWPFWYRYW